MYPSKRKRFVPPLKGDQGDGNNSIDSLEPYSQISYTQSSPYSVNSISFFSEPAVIKNAFPKQLDDSIEELSQLLQAENQLENSLTLENEVKELHVSPDLSQQKGSETTNRWKHLPSRKKNQALTIYKFNVGEKNITKKVQITNPAAPHSTKTSHTNSASSNAKDELERSSDGVFDFPVSQKSLKETTVDASAMSNRKRSHSLERSCDLARKLNASSISGRTHEEQALIDDEVLSIISQSRKDSKLIRMKLKKDLNDAKFIADVNDLLAQAIHKKGSQQTSKMLSFFITGHEE